jgi:hypothetical protein
LLGPVATDTVTDVLLAEAAATPVGAPSVLELTAWLVLAVAEKNAHAATPAAKNTPIVSPRAVRIRRVMKSSQ